MKKLIKILGWTLLTIYMVTCMSYLFAINAQAYIDPSAVTYLIQAVAAVLIAIGACLTIFRHKIIAFFKRGKGEEQKKEIHFTDEADESQTGIEDIEDVK